MLLKKNELNALNPRADKYKPGSFAERQDLVKDGAYLRHPITETVRLGAPETPVPATWDQLRPGVRVKCIYCPGARCHGKIGTIKSVDRGVIEVMWDDGDPTSQKWGYANSFTVLSDPPSPRLGWLLKLDGALAKLRADPTLWTITPFNHGAPAAVAPETTTPVNDHVCPTCKCDRVSKSEARCWRCGGDL